MSIYKHAEKLSQSEIKAIQRVVLFKIIATLQSMDEVRQETEQKILIAQTMLDMDETDVLTQALTEIKQELSKKLHDYTQYGEKELEIYSVIYKKMIEIDFDDPIEITDFKNKDEVLKVVKLINYR